MPEIKEGFFDCFEIKGEDETTKEPEEEFKDDGEEETSKIGLFDFLKDITSKKEGDLLDANTESEFNKFMILRFLACDPELVEYVNIVEPYQDVLTKEQLYELLIAMIPQKFRYLKYRIDDSKQPSNEVVDRMLDTFEVSREDAYRYAQLLSENERKRFVQSFGGELK